jgi:hypothetical protein
MLMLIHWRELDPAMPVMSLAGRHDDVVATRGSAAAAVVQFASTALNESSLNYAIQRQLLGSKSPSRYFKNERPASARGLLARAIIGVRDNANGMVGRYLVAVVFCNLYQDPRQGIDRETHIDGALPTPNPSDTTETRWFWGRRVQEAVRASA